MKIHKKNHQNNENNNFFLHHINISVSVIKCHLFITFHVVLCVCVCVCSRVFIALIMYNIKILNKVSLPMFFNKIKCWKSIFLHLRPLCVMEDVFNNNNKHYFITRAFYTQKIINNVTPFTSHSCERFCVYLRCVFSTHQKVIQLFMALFFHNDFLQHTCFFSFFITSDIYWERTMKKHFSNDNIQPISNLPNTI